MRKDELQDYNNAEVSELEAILEVSPTLRGRFLELLLFLTICFSAMYILKQVNPNGYILGELLGFKMAILKKQLSYNFFAYPLRVIGLLALARVVYIWLQQLTTKYRITDQYLEKRHGIFIKESNTIDLVKIDDQTERQNFLDMILFISRIIVYAKRDKTDPELHIIGITKSDATKLLNFLRKNSHSSITELRLAQERKRNREKSVDKSKKEFIDDDYSDE